MSEEKRNDEELELDRDCTCVDSDICYWLANRVGCDKCYIGTLKSDEQKIEARDRWKQTVSLLPKNFDSLHESDECQFCKGTVEKADGYGMVEMANPEPSFSKGMFFGFGKKVRTPVGSMVSVQASVCPKCRKAFLMGDILQIGSLVGFVVLGIVLLLIPQISNPMAAVFPLLPVVFLLLMGAAGYFIGKNAQAAHLKKAAKSVKIDLAEISIIAMMLSRNWFFFQTNNGVPRVSFAKQKQYGRMIKKQNQDNCDDNDTPDDNIPLDNMNI